jgi:glucose/arabinose dehydrogenase
MNSLARPVRMLLLALVLATGGGFGVASAQTPTSSFDPGQFTFNLQPLVQGLNQPVQLVDPDDGSGRMFIVQKSGQILIFKDGAVSDTPYLDISSQVSGDSEQGLLSMAPHPDFGKSGRFYIDYTDTAGDTQIEEWSVSTDNADTADPATAKTILSVDQPFPNHNGGLLLFGPDGYLYIGLGDGGSQGDPNGNGQNQGVLLGKILRINIDNSEGDLPYSIPKDNPFAGSKDARSEIWAYGLRNPWRFSFDRETGDLYIGDVGQGEYEEADFAGQQGGLNFGWNITEGTSCYAQADCDQSGITLPFFTYKHSDGSGCSITGGYVYRGEAIKADQGAYIAGDYCSGYVWAINPATGDVSDKVETGLSISSFAEDADGELYVIDLNGAIYSVGA